MNNGKRNVDGAEALTDISGTGIGSGIVIGSKLKRGIVGVGGWSASIAHWGVGNGYEADKRSNSGVGVNNGVLAEDAGDVVGNRTCVEAV